MEDNDTWFDAGSECKSAVSMIRRSEIDNLHLHAQIRLRESRSRRVFYHILMEGFRPEFLSMGDGSRRSRTQANLLLGTVFNG